MADADSNFGSAAGPGGVPWCFPTSARAAIFDLDGVLLDTEPLYTRATAAVAARFDKTFDWTLKSQCIGRGSEEAARLIVDTLGLPLSPRDFLRDRDAVLGPLFRDAPAMPGAEAFTRTLAGRGVPLAVATGSESRLFASKVAPYAEWFSLFAAVVCGDDRRVRRGKPAPDIFLAAAADLGMPPADCVVFEDSPFGVVGALAAGMRVVAMPDPAMDRARYAGATVIVDGFRDLAVRP